MLTVADKSPKNKKAIASMYFSAEELRGILKDAGDAGVVSMILYMGIAHLTKPLMEDAHIAKLLGKSVTAIRDTRLKLTKANWFKRVKQTSKGNTIIVYLVGKQVVEDYVLKGNLQIKGII